jgi:hypothetical protein
MLRNGGNARLVFALVCLMIALIYKVGISGGNYTNSNQSISSGASQKTTESSASGGQTSDTSSICAIASCNENRISEEGHYCRLHTCEKVDCYNKRYENGTIYCDSHASEYLIENGYKGCSKTGCYRRRDEEDWYCSEHSCKVKGCMISVSVADGEEYCILHDKSSATSSSTNTSTDTGSSTNKSTSSGKKNSSSSSKKSSASYKDQEYDDPEDFYYDNYDDFEDYDEAEEYWIDNYE